MREVQAHHRAQRVLDAGGLQIPSVVVRQRQQVEPEALERVDRLGWRQEPPTAARGRLDDRRLEVREDDVAFEEWGDGLCKGRRVDTDVRPDGGLTGQREADRPRLAAEPDAAGCRESEKDRRNRKTAAGCRDCHERESTSERTRGTQARAIRLLDLGYYAALGLYPGGRHQGLIFHNILGGSFTIGTTLRRFFDLQGDDVNLTFPANVNRQGDSETYVKMHRLTNAADMLGR